MAAPSDNETNATTEHKKPEDYQSNLMRQTSIYSLTLEEIQNTVCEPGKTFGSMNMDEFLTNIWNVEEGHAITATVDSSDRPNAAASDGGGPPPSLYRQSSLNLPAPLSRKTVDEVWSEIHRGQVPQPFHHVDPPHQDNTGIAPRQPTLGEMTLEDFLVKAGVVREGLGPCSSPPQPLHQQQQQYGMPSYQMAIEGQEVSHVGYRDHQNGSGYAAANGGGYGGEACFGSGGRMGNGFGGQQMVMGSPVSPVSSDGLGSGQVDNSGLHYGSMEMGGARGGRKRAADGTGEKVVERRQRRMIKNRESAARSRARKQAYTVELEAELNQLREESTRLKEEEKKMQSLRRQLLLDSMAEHARTKAEKSARMLRRCNSCPW